MRLLLPALLLLLPQPCLADPAFDGWHWRTGQDPGALEAELKRLRDRLFDPAFSEADATRLAALQVAQAASSAAGYRRSLGRVTTARQHVFSQSRAILEGGPYRAEWLNARWMNSAVSARAPEARELFRRTFADQFVLQASPPELTDAEREALSSLLIPEARRIGRENALWLKQTLERIGWFDISRYGAEASQAAWLIVQHADFDPSWQADMLRVLETRVAKGDMQPRYYAYLVDRVARNAGRPQTYGTQGRCVRPGDWQPFEHIEPASLDARRASVGLDPIATYRANFTCR